MVKREFSLTFLDRSDTGILQILSQKISENYTLLWKGLMGPLPEDSCTVGGHFLSPGHNSTEAHQCTQLKGQAGRRGQLGRGGVAVGVGEDKGR